MHKIGFVILGLSISFSVFCQKKEIYHPEADAKKDISAAIETAKRENKFVLLQGGGNWCKWCLEFYRFCKEDKAIDSVIQSNFIWYHLNYSKENKNELLFNKYGFPQRFGFPVFIILDQQGNRIHTQDSGLLEDGKESYDKEKVLNFLSKWTPRALDTSTYIKK